MSVEFFNAKNGSKTAKANGLLLHSQYNPEEEAARFANMADADFIPKNILVIEGALGYCAEALSLRFANAKIGTIRICADFCATNEKWDFAINDFFQKEKGSLSEKLYALFGEEGLFQTLFLEWPPAVRAFPAQTKDIWCEIKMAMQKAQSVLATREYFAKRWLKNKIIFFKRISRAAILQKIQKPIVICASGPSLQVAIPLIKKMRKKIFVVSLSSAHSVLLFNKITPDLCFSTDGGFWAKAHFFALNFFLKNAPPPIALATEGACPAHILKNATLLPLCYEDDALSKKIFSALHIPYMNARRNGTVSGTALEFFLSFGAKNIFFAGLDLSCGATLSHAKPNALEIFFAQKDFRLSPKALRIAKTFFSSSSLDFYARYFKNFFWTSQNKIYRIFSKEYLKNALGKIQDISANEAEKLILQIHNFQNKNTKKNQDKIFVFYDLEKNEKRICAIKSAIEEFSQTREWPREMFASDWILFERAKNNKEKLLRKKVISQKTQKLLLEIFAKM